MLILALETSTELGSCALWRDGQVHQRVCPAGRSHSETLLPLVRELLADAGMGVADLDGIAFGVGPGAFTGLRVACGAAQGLAVVANTPLLPVTSLSAMAEASGAQRVLALLDARMGEVYAGAYERQVDRWVLQGEIRVGAPDQVILPEGADWRVCGNALAAYPALAERVATASLREVDGVMPTAAAVAVIAAGQLQRGEGIDAALAAPLYVRDKVAKTVAERLAEGGRA